MQAAKINPEGATVMQVRSTPSWMLPGGYEIAYSSSSLVYVRCYSCTYEQICFVDNNAHQRQPRREFIQTMILRSVFSGCDCGQFKPNQTLEGKTDFYFPKMSTSLHAPAAASCAL